MPSKNYKMSLEEWDSLAAPPMEQEKPSPAKKPMKLQAPPDKGDERARNNARADFARFSALKTKFEAAGKKYGVPVEYLAGLSSRESNMGGALRGGKTTGDQGDAFGIMQINRKFHKLRGTSAIDSQEHIDQGAEIIAENKRYMDTRYPKWTEEQRWRGAIAAYNVGPDDITDPKNIDVATTGQDYSKDVILRARALREWSQ